MSALTGKQESFIAMMRRSDELAIKGFQLLLQRDDFASFFGPLQEAGFFAADKNPGPLPGERENTVRVPYWPPLSYLKAVAQHVGAHNDLALAVKVMTVVRSVSTWRDEKGEPRRNYHTNRTFAEILGLLPTDAVTSDDIELTGVWLDDPFERMLIVDALDNGALPRFLNSASPEDWEKAARVLYHVTAISWSKDGNESEPTPYSIADDYFLSALLRNHAKQIGVRAGEHATEIMLARVREVFSTPIRRDHSSAFRPAVEDDPQNHQWRSVENRVVEGLRDVILGWADHDADSARAVVRSMLTDDLQIIRRVGIYVLAQHWTSMHDLYTGVVGPGFFNDGHGHELYHLLQDHFAEVSPEQQAATVAAIEALPNPGYGDDPERLRRHNQYRWLSAIHDKGYAPADHRFAELDADPAVGKLSGHPDFDSFITSWVGPGPTPYSPEELTALAKAQTLVEKLNTFVPRHEWEGPTTEGLISALEAATRSNPDIFLDNLSQLFAAKPIYQHAVINGLKQALEGKNDINWEQGWGQLVTFFEQLLTDPNFWQQTDDMHQSLVVTVIADTLHAGTQKDEQAYDARLLPRTQDIIASLLQRQPGIDTPADDAMTQALNTTKGRIVEALFSQALRAARVSEQQRAAHQEAWEAIRPLFETELAKCKNANYEFSTLSGAYLPQLQYLDATWTTERIDQIFPVTYEANTVCALDGLAYASFTRPIYELLAAHGIIDRALGLELKGRSARGKLLERVGAAYLWGVEVLDGERFTRLFATASLADLEVLTRLFWMVRGEKLTDEQRERVLAFWEQSLSWAQRQPQPPAHLLSMLSLLAAHITTLGAREQRLLETVAPHVHVGHETYEFVAELLRLAQQNPLAVTKVLRCMVAAHVPEYDYEDRLRSLLEFLAEHGQRDAAILISDRLRHLDGVQALFKILTQH
ncbi:MAG: hypothetical protein WA188_15230 [Terriglobales bacterium]